VRTARAQGVAGKRRRGRGERERGRGWEGRRALLMGGLLVRCRRVPTLVGHAADGEAFLVETGETAATRRARA
jgi:hypothetical protein